MSVCLPYAIPIWIDITRDRWDATGQIDSGLIPMLQYPAAQPQTVKSTQHSTEYEWAPIVLL